MGGWSAQDEKQGLFCVGELECTLDIEPELSAGMPAALHRRHHQKKPKMVGEFIYSLLPNILLIFKYFR